jgi:sugar phosphate isomerase/epimerase
MYTIREFTKTSKDLADSLRRIREIGYPAVQVSAVGAMNGESPEVSAAQAKQMLDDNGLKCIATHRNWDDLVNKTEKEIEFHKTLGCDYVAIGGIPASYRPQGAAGFRQWIAEAQPIIAHLKAEGLQFGYHNHAFEFERAQPGPGGNPQTLYDILIDEGGPDMLLEMDVYWVDHAGVNPEKIIQRCVGKLPVIHIKDKEMVGADPVMAPIGEGNLDWDGLLPALANAGTQWVAVEHDICRRDPFDYLQSSYNFLTNHPVFKG